MIRTRQHWTNSPAQRVRSSEPDAEWLDSDDLRFLRRVAVGVLCVWALLVTGALAL